MGRCCWASPAGAESAVSRRLQDAEILDQPFGEHIDIVRMMKDRDIDGACTLLREHILVITDSLDTLPLAAGKEVQA